jgi:hypothetical protein
VSPRAEEEACTIKAGPVDCRRQRGFGEDCSQCE